LDEMDYCISENLLVTNTKLIHHICDKLSIATKIVTDFPTDLTKTERLVDICCANNADTYLSGPSGEKYIDLNLFEKRGIDVIYQDQNNTTKTPILDTLKHV
jgi:hypothetical protein